MVSACRLGRLSYSTMFMRCLCATQHLGSAVFGRRCSLTGLVDVRHISRGGGNGRSEVGDEVVADATGSPPPLPSQRSRPSRCVCPGRRGRRGRGMRPVQRCGCASCHRGTRRPCAQGRPRARLPSGRCAGTRVRPGPRRPRAPSEYIYIYSANEQKGIYSAVVTCQCMMHDTAQQISLLVCNYRLSYSLSGEWLMARLRVVGACPRPRESSGVVLLVQI
jgi:hypothetical protein